MSQIIDIQLLIAPPLQLDLALSPPFWLSPEQTAQYYKGDKGTFEDLTPEQIASFTQDCLKIQAFLSEFDTPEKIIRVRQNLQLNDIDLGTFN